MTGEHREGAREGVVHGGLLDAEVRAAGLDPVNVVDLSANLHAAGPHPSVLRAAAYADVTRYPEPDARTLRDAIARHRGLEPAQVLVTPGATAAIHLVARALLATGDVCALFTPAFSEYEAAVRAAGARIVEHPARLPDFAPALADVRPAPLAYLCNPNNPTGAYLERTEVERLAAAMRGTLVLDAAYEAFVDGGWDPDGLVRDGWPVLVLHSFTKLHAIPGLRVGFVAGPAPLIARLRREQHAWAVGAPETAAALAALEVDAEQREAARPMMATCERLRHALLALGLEVNAPRANFVLARPGEARDFRARLLRRGFAVRDCTSFGLPEWVRIAVPAEEHLARLVDALRETVEERPR